MAYPIELNCLYQFCGNRWQKIDSLPSNLSKLSLFDVTELSALIPQLLSAIPDLISGACFQHCERESLGYWEVFAEYETLKNITRHCHDNYNHDYLLWPELTHDAPQLLLFDMDSTFIEIEVIDELARQHGVGEQVSQVTEAAMRGELDFSESLVSRVSCLKGLSENVIERIAHQLPLSTGVKQLVNSAMSKGCQIAIVSGGFEPFVEHLQEQLGLFRVCANKLEVDQKKLTGRVKGAIVDAQAKEDFLYELCNELKISPKQAMAIGDGANDLKMMKAAGFNLAYRAKPKVQAEAMGRMNHINFEQLVSIFNW